MFRSEEDHPSLSPLTQIEKQLLEGATQKGDVSALSNVLDLVLAARYRGDLCDQDELAKMLGVERTKEGYDVREYFTACFGIADNPAYRQLDQAARVRARATAMEAMKQIQERGRQTG